MAMSAIKFQFELRNGKPRLDWLTTDIGEVALDVDSFK